MNREEKIAMLRELLRKDGVQVDGMSDEEVVNYRSPSYHGPRFEIPPGSYTPYFLVRPRRDTGGNA